MRTTAYYARREGGGGREREGEGGRGGGEREREGYRTLCQAHHNFLFLFKLSTNTTVPVCTAWGHGGMEQRLQNHPYSLLYAPSVFYLLLYWRARPLYSSMYMYIVHVQHKIMPMRLHVHVHVVAWVHRPLTLNGWHTTKN